MPTTVGKGSSADVRENLADGANGLSARRRMYDFLSSGRILVYTPEAKRILTDRPDLIKFYFKHVYEPEHRSRVGEAMEAEGVRVFRIKEEYGYTNKALHRLKFGEHDLFVKENWPTIDPDRTGPMEFMALLNLRRLIEEHGYGGCIQTVEPVLAFAGYNCNFIITRYDERFGDEGWRLRGVFDAHGKQDDANQRRHEEFCGWIWDNSDIGDAMEKNSVYDYNRHVTVMCDPRDFRRPMDQLENIIELSRSEKGVRIATSFQPEKTKDYFQSLILAEGRYA